MIAQVGLVAVVFLLALAATGLVRRYALARLIDVPNARSSHSIPTPRGGGLAIVLAFVAGSLLAAVAGWLSWALFAVLLSGALVAAVGFIDDHRHVPARYRLLAHLAAAAIALVGIGGFAEIPLGAMAIRVDWLATAFALLWLAWMLNLYNFMDGIDAITGSEVVFVAASGALLSAVDGGGAAVLPLGLLAAATAGFQCWNLPPARIFMGDVGSGFVGFMLALLALIDMQSPGGGLGLPVWFTLNGVFLVDASCTLLRRVATGQRWYEAHRSHVYQKLALSWGSHAAVVKSALAVNVLWLLPLAAAELAWPSLSWLIAAVALAPLIALALRLKAGLP